MEETLKVIFPGSGFTSKKCTNLRFLSKVEELAKISVFTDRAFKIL